MSNTSARLRHYGGKDSATAGTNIKKKTPQQTMWETGKKYLPDYAKPKKKTPKVGKKK